MKQKAIVALRNNVANLLIKNRRTATQLSEHLGTNRSWASKLIRGRRERVSMQYLDVMSEYFGVEPYELFLPVEHPMMADERFEPVPRATVSRRRNLDFAKAARAADTMLSRRQVKGKRKA